LQYNLFSLNSNVSEFILLRLSYDQNIKTFCFVLFLFCYIALLVGSLLILISIRCSSLFHQPTYYFVSHLSSMDICYTSMERKNISYGNCMLQVFSKHLFGMTEVLILTVMAFDRYVAIRKPLHYVIITNRTRYNLLVLAAWACGAVHSFPQFSVIIQLPFCGANKIDRYFCDIFPLLKVACTDTYITGVIMLVNSRMVTLRTFVILFFSYVTILFTLRNHSAEGKLLFFGPSIFTYLRPPTTFPEDKIFARSYTIIAPMFNPLIYTLRNSEMKNAMRKVWFQTL
uniref:Olfactory receptor n=1 Tax=Phocoena sinus TaxID=42100 RepID=A0A8C9C9V5_PHOSS